MRTAPGGHTGRLDVRGWEKISPSSTTISPWGAQRVPVPILLALLTYLSPLSSPYICL